MDDVHSKTDEEIAKCVSVDKNAFGALIQRYEKPLARYIKRIGILSSDDRDDVLQNIFIKVYKNINSFDGDFSFSSWIYRIAHNEAISFFRAKKIRPEGNLVEDGEDALSSFYSDETDDALEISEQKINAEHLIKALNELDEKYRTVVILRYFENKDYDEISHILQIPLGSVATLIHRARKNLHAKLSSKLS